MKAGENMQLDRTDRKLLRALVANGRATQQELGEAAGLSPSAAALVCGTAPGMLATQ
jgi:DNA-binding Lrp family transcriptional regulator